MAELIDKLKQHLHFEEGMDDSMFPFYLETAKKYVKRATGYDTNEHLILMVASIMYEYRVSESELEKALDAITPFIIQEAIGDGQTNDE